MAHATSTPVKGKSPATPKKPLPTPPATPEMIEAVFAVLHLEGWRPKHSSAFTVLPTPALKPKVKAPTRDQVKAAWELAAQLGWTPLNDQEKALIITLRRATYKGRNIVSDLARTIARTYPWDWNDNSGRNTEE